MAFRSDLDNLYNFSKRTLLAANSSASFNCTCDMACLCISAYSHIKIFKVVRHHQNEIQIQQQAVEINSDNVNSMSSLKKSAFNALLIFLALVICYSPFFIFLSGEFSSSSPFIPQQFPYFNHCFY